MKKYFLTISISCILSLSLFSCGGNKVDEAGTTDQTDQTETEDSYDADAIDPNAKVVEVEINANGNTMAEISYDLPEIIVPAGCAVKIKFKNNSTDEAMPHNIIFIERGSAQEVVDAGMIVGQSGGFKPDMSQVIAGSNLLGPGEFQEFIFMAPAPGEYQFICTFPGHLKAMNGRFIVEE